MDEAAVEPMLVLHSDPPWCATDRIWGTGRWIPPKDREGLDWLTLSRLLGWGVTALQAAASPRAVRATKEHRWIIVACDPERLGRSWISSLSSRLQTDSVFVVARAAAPGTKFARLAGAAARSGRSAGQSLDWVGPGAGRHWNCRKRLHATGLKLESDVAIWATLDSRPFIVARKLGRGLIATIGFHPSRARDTDGAATALLRHLLIWGADWPVAWLDFENTMVLRMDDPGGAQNIYNRNWNYPKISEPAWKKIGTVLKQRKARLTIGYVPGWVDDGDAARGHLEINGVEPIRHAGRVHASPLVKYRDLRGCSPGTVHNYAAEFRGIQSLRSLGLADVEVHGYTHLHPDTAGWARARSRYSSMNWYRELGRPASAVIAARPPEAHPLALAMTGLRRYFGADPTTLICPGDEWTNTALKRALDLGLQLVGSYYLAIRHQDSYCWTQHVCAPYLDTPDPAWFDAGLPVVGYFHDREPALEGVGWMAKWLDRWQAVGARRFIDYRELAAALGRRLSLSEDHGLLSLTVTSLNAPALPRPLSVNLHAARVSLPERLTICSDGRETSTKVHRVAGGIGRIFVI